MLVAEWNHNALILIVVPRSNRPIYLLQPSNSLEEFPCSYIAAKKASVIT